MTYYQSSQLRQSLMYKIYSIFIFLLVSLVAIPASTANYIDQEGRGWRDLSETVGFSWDEINSIPRDATGAFVGSLQSNITGELVDFTGWRWASLEMVDALFAELSPNPQAVFENTISPIDDPVASKMIDLLGNTETDNDPRYDLARGWTSTEFGDAAYTPTVQDLIILDSNLPLIPFDAVNDTIALSKSFASPYTGVYLWTPVPAAVWLFGTALIGLVAFGRRRKTA